MITKELIVHQNECNSKVIELCVTDNQFWFSTCMQLICVDFSKWVRANVLGKIFITRLSKIPEVKVSKRSGHCNSHSFHNHLSLAPQIWWSRPDESACHKIFIGSRNAYLTVYVLIAIPKTVRLVHLNIRLECTYFVTH